MKVIMTGGGTGGHIYPAIAIAEKIKRKHPEAEILFVGTQRGMEKDLVPGNGFPIRFITVSGFHRKKLWKNVQTARDLAKGMREAKQILDEFSPDVVIGTGGYVCGPVVRAAYKKGIRTYIHEQNVLPGVTNKLLERYAEKIFLSFGEAAEHFKKKDKLVVTGNPIRKQFLTSGIHDYRKKMGIDPKEFVVLCFGGSRGAGRINSAMTETVKTLSGMADVRLFFITGKIHYEKIREELKQQGIALGNSIMLLPYAENMHEYLAAADLVISRAGALTVSEITVCGKASILIPSPNVTGNHQYYNARVVADHGGAFLIEETDLTAEKLTDTILRLKGNKELLNKMSGASEALGRADSVDVIYDNLDLTPRA